jgi:hypothetical protein
MVDELELLDEAGSLDDKATEDKTLLALDAVGAGDELPLPPPHADSKDATKNTFIILITAISILIINRVHT